jgi:hypothetical protein
MLPGALVAQAIEALLSGASKAALSPAVTDLAAALAGLEQRVALLEQASPPAPPPAPPASPDRVITAAHLGEALPLPDRRLTPAEALDLVPLPQVADELGLGGGGSAITNWIAREARSRGGAVPLGAVYRGWRLRGKGLLPGGQKPGWLFDRAG